MGPPQRPHSAALSGSLPKAPGSAGGYLLFSTRLAASCCGHFLDTAYDAPSVVFTFSVPTGWRFALPRYARLRP